MKHKGVTRGGPRILTLRGRLWHYGHWHGHSRGGEGEGGGVKREQQDASSHTLSTLFGCVDMVDIVVGLFTHGGHDGYGGHNECGVLIWYERHGGHVRHGELGGRCVHIWPFDHLSFQLEMNSWSTVLEKSPLSWESKILPWLEEDWVCGVVKILWDIL